MTEKQEISTILHKTDLLLNDVIHLTRDLFKGDNFKNNVKYLFNKTFRINDSQNIILNSNLFKQDIKINQQGGKKRRFNNTKKYVKSKYINKSKPTKNKTKNKK